jgi:hypothetical protein
MSTRYTQARTFLILLALVSTPSSFQTVAGKQAAAGAPQGQGALSLKLSGVDKPIKGAPYRFSLCAGRLLGPKEMSGPCNPADAAKTVGGTTQNLPIVFRLETTSFLPPGFTLDGFGVINGAPDADLSKLKTVRICAFQVGAIGTNFGSKCQELNFNGYKEVPKPQAQTTRAKSGGGGATAVKAGVLVGGGVGGAVVTKKALDSLKASQEEADRLKAEFDRLAGITGGTPTSGPTTTPSGFNGTYDFQFVFTNPGGDSTRTLPQFFRVNNGVITASDGSLSGSVTSAGAVTFVGPCPINNDPADYSGSLTTAGAGQGPYRCRTGGIARTWSVFNRR